MQEFAENVVDVGQSSSPPFDWNLELNPQEDVIPAGSGGGVGSPGARMTRRPTGRDGGAGTRPIGRLPRDFSARPAFSVGVGELVTRLTTPGAKKSVSVGNVTSITAEDSGDELELQWYMTVRTAPNCSRSE